MKLAMLRYTFDFVGRSALAILAIVLPTLASAEIEEIIVTAEFRETK
jgi:hypothetical protein